MTYSFRTAFVFILGLIGACLASYGHSEIFPHPYYLSGAILLLIFSLYFQLPFFVSLEAILIFLYLSQLLELPERIQQSLPLLLGIQIFVYCYFAKFLGDPWVWLGVFGIIGLTAGISLDSHWMYLTGSLLLSAYSIRRISDTHGFSLLWALQYLLFSLIIAVKIYLQHNALLFS